jgi:hypothetical protein
MRHKDRECHETETQKPEWVTEVRYSLLLLVLVFVSSWGLHWGSFHTSSCCREVKTFCPSDQHCVWVEIRQGCHMLQYMQVMTVVVSPLGHSVWVVDLRVSPSTDWKSSMFIGTRISGHPTGNEGLPTLAREIRGSQESWCTDGMTAKTQWILLRLRITDELLGNRSRYNNTKRHRTHSHRNTDCWLVCIKSISKLIRRRLFRTHERG